MADQNGNTQVFSAIRTVDVNDPSLPFQAMTIKTLANTSSKSSTAHIIDVLADVPGVGRTVVGTYRARYRAPISVGPRRVQDANSEWHDDPNFPDALRAPKLRTAVEEAACKALGITVVQKQPEAAAPPPAPPVATDETVPPEGGAS